MVPNLHGWGWVASESCLFFYVCDYILLTQVMPESTKLAQLVANLHGKTVSSNGKFRFYLSMYDGWQAQDVGQWDKTWTTCFTRILKGLWELDADMNGHWAELDSAMKVTLNMVIPRLIGIMEHDGRTIKPCLIHGDLWETNIGMDVRMSEIYIFDAAACYGHNEMEVAIWCVSYHKMKVKTYCQAYVKQCKKSELVEEWGDRLKLYGVKTKLMYSVGVPNGHGI